MIKKKKKETKEKGKKKKDPKLISAIVEIHSNGWRKQANKPHRFYWIASLNNVVCRVQENLQIYIIAIKIVPPNHFPFKLTNPSENTSSI